jgi:hypothetical protein
MGLYEEQATTEHPELYPDLTLAEVRTLGKMASNDISAEGTIQRCSVQTLARQAALTPSGFKKHRAKLLALGYITTEHQNPLANKPSLFDPNVYRLNLREHPANCTNGRHIDKKIKASNPSAADPRHTVAHPLGTQLPTPSHQVPEGQPQEDQLKKDKVTEINPNTYGSGDSCIQCEGLKLGNHRPSCKLHPAHRAPTPWSITQQQYQGSIPWESLSDDQQQERHKQRVTEWQRSQPPTAEQLLDQTLLKLNAADLSPGNRAFCLRPKTDLERAVGRALKFQAKGYEPKAGYTGNPYTEFLEGDYTNFQQLPDTKA